ATTFEAAAFTQQGTTRDKVELPQPLFDGTVNAAVMHQAVKAFLANQRQGNAMTKTRGLVAGGNRKPWKQKGTGRARQGSIRAPNWVGGGTVFGPIPRSYAQYVPRQVRALARKSALNARAREGAIVVIDRLDFEAPKTSRMRELLDRLGLDGRKVLVLTDGVKPSVFLSARNLPDAHVMPYRDVSTYHILWSDVVVIESGALGGELEPAGDDATADEAEGEAHVPAGAATRSRRKTSAKREAKKRTAKKAGARKAAAKRPAAKGTAKKKTARKSTRKRGS
ncbi:MAG: 50S ribosomal protein L4, partial [Gemmatimonadota bacterium]|nr:50S ribosomal protein L4 [Gemmatimonadota bacterium]